MCACTVYIQGRKNQPSKAPTLANSSFSNTALKSRDWILGVVSQRKKNENEEGMGLKGEMEKR